MWQVVGARGRGEGAMLLFVLGRGDCHLDSLLVLSLLIS